MVNDELEPCIEDIRLEIDRLRREEQILRERLTDKKKDSSSTLSKTNISSDSSQTNPVGFSIIPGSPQDSIDLQESNKSRRLFPLSANPSIENHENPPTTPTIDEQEPLVNSEDEDEATPIAVDEAPTECKLKERLIS